MPNVTGAEVYVDTFREEFMFFSITNKLQYKTYIIASLGP